MVEWGIARCRQVTRRPLFQWNQLLDLFSTSNFPLFFKEFQYSSRGDCTKPNYFGLNGGGFWTFVHENWTSFPRSMIFYYFKSFCSFFSSAFEWFLIFFNAIDIRPPKIATIHSRCPDAIEWQAIEWGILWGNIFTPPIASILIGF